MDEQMYELEDFEMKLDFRFSKCYLFKITVKTYFLMSKTVRREGLSDKKKGEVTEEKSWCSSKIWDE